MDIHVIGAMTVSAALDTALAYAARGLRVFPCQWRGSRRKNPLTEHGFKDASADPAVILAWWTDWPPALIGAPTGDRSGFDVLDVDVKDDRDGCTTLAVLGFPEFPTTPRARTASGGFHLYFEPPADRKIRNTAGARGRGIGPGLDWRGDGGYVILPSPGSGYEWEIEIGFVPFARVPVALLPKEQVIETRIGTAVTTDILSPYGEAALVSAAQRIMTAPNGAQEWTLNAEALSIARLAAAGGVPIDLAKETLVKAGLKMTNYKERDPWTENQITYKVKRAFDQGLTAPRPEWREPERDEQELARQWPEAEAPDA